MKLMSTFAAVIVGCASLAAAGDGHKHDKKDQPTTKPVNKVCPVMDSDVDPAAGTVDHNGKTYGFCCADCIPDFKKDPEKYVSKAK